MAILILIAFLATRKLSLIPSGFQSIMEIVIESLYTLFESVLGKYIKTVFPLVTTIFLFVIIANWEGLLPGFGTIGFKHEVTETSVTHEATTEEKITETHAIVSEEQAIVSEEKKEVKEETSHGSKFTPLLRGATADLNMTLALAIVAVIAIQVYGFMALGGGYSKRFINISNPIMFFVGFLEIISDLSKIISFAFRLFGNIFAGEVLLTVIAFLMPFIAPMPFYVLELFVGFIQAIVFSMLTSVFVNVAMTHEEH